MKQYLLTPAIPPQVLDVTKGLKYVLRRSSRDASRKVGVELRINDLL